MANPSEPLTVDYLGEQENVHFSNSGSQVSLCEICGCSGVGGSDTVGFEKMPELQAHSVVPEKADKNYLGSLLRVMRSGTVRRCG